MLETLRDLLCAQSNRFATGNDSDSIGASGAAGQRRHIPVASRLNKQATGSTGET
jgi:hypothetical protein